MKERPNEHGPSAMAGAAPSTGDTTITAQDTNPQAASPAHLPPTPPGGRLLTADEAVELLIIGDHPGTLRGTIQLDAALVDALRDGWIVACRMPDGQIAFTRIAQDTTGPTPPT